MLILNQLYLSGSNLLALARLDSASSMAPQFTMRLRDRRVQLGFPVRLTCQIVGIPRPQVTWFKNDDLVTPDGNVFGFLSLFQICIALDLTFLFIHFIFFWCNALFAVGRLKFFFPRCNIIQTIGQGYEVILDDNGLNFLFHLKEHIVFSKRYSQLSFFGSFSLFHHKKNIVTTLIFAVIFRSQLSVVPPKTR